MEFRRTRRVEELERSCLGEEVGRNIFELVYIGGTQFCDYTRSLTRIWDRGSNKISAALASNHTCAPVSGGNILAPNCRLIQSSNLKVKITCEARLIVGP